MVLLTWYGWRIAIIHENEASDHGEIATTEGADVLLVGAIDDYLPAAARSADESGGLPDR